jgi:hypothetical protein
MSENAPRTADDTGPRWWRWYWPVSLTLIAVVEALIVVGLVTDLRDADEGIEDLIVPWFWGSLLLAWPFVALMLAMFIWVICGEAWSVLQNRRNR